MMIEYVAIKLVDVLVNSVEQNRAVIAVVTHVRATIRK